MNRSDGKDTQRETASAILTRSPVDYSRRASFGSEERTEHVVLHWQDGRSRRLEQSQDDRISFALRDHFEASQPTCREQMQRLVTVLGAPATVTVAWSYRSDWEGQPPLSQTGRYQFAWADVAGLLNMPGDAGNR